MRLQLYGTYVGPGYIPQMYYVDETGNGLLLNKSIRAISGIQQYLGLVVEHPLIFAGVFARHLVNGLDVRYSTPYTEHLRTDWWLRVGGFLFVFGALLRVLWTQARRSLGPALWRYPVATLLCCATAVLSAVETRFLLPVFILSYAIVLAPGWPSPLASNGPGLRRYRLPAVVFVACVLFAAVIWHVTSGASHNLQI